MTDMHGVTPEGGAQPPKPGEEHAQHTAPAGQQPSYQQTYQQSPYQAPVQPQGYRAPAPVSVERKSHGLRTFLLAFCGAALACVIGLGGFAIWQAATGNSGGSSDDGQHTQLGAQSSGSVDAGDEDPTLAEAVAKKALPSVAAIDVYTNQSSMGGLYGYGYGSGANSGADSNTLTQSSLGSGVVLTEDGYIITNNHVVSGASQVTVRTSDGTEYPATVVGADSKTDIAVLKIEATGLTPAVVGDSDSLQVGEFTLAVGNPLGELGGTVTDGIISALDREVTVENQTMNLLQTNAAVSPGNSGGGLFNERGELIGIVNAKSSGQNAEGLGFAIPVNTAIQVAEELINNGYVTGRPAMGVTVLSINDAQTAFQYGVNQAGVYVQSVNEGGAADKAGLQPGDRFVSIDGTAVNSTSDITGIIGEHAVGDTIEVQVVRGTQIVTANVTLEESTPQASSTQRTEG